MLLLNPSKTRPKTKIFPSILNNIFPSFQEMPCFVLWWWMAILIVLYVCSSCQNIENNMSLDPFVLFTKEIQNAYVYTHVCLGKVINLMLLNNSLMSFRKIYNLFAFLSSDWEKYCHNILCKKKICQWNMLLHVFLATKKFSFIYICLYLRLCT